MENLSTISVLQLITGTLLIIILIFSTVVSVKEKEWRAATRLFTLSLVISLLYIIIPLIPGDVFQWISFGLFVITTLFALVILLPTRFFEKKADKINPKGVLVPHSAVVNFLCSMAKEPGMTSGDTLLAGECG